MNDHSLSSISKVVETEDFKFPIYHTGSGPAVLLLHGFPDSRYMWRYQIEPIVQAGFQVIVPDLRGFGDAPKPANVENYQLKHILQDLNQILAALNIHQVNVIGHDWGSTAGWLYAGNFPDKTISVAGLTVGAPGGTGRRVLPQLEKLWYVFFFQNHGIAEEWLVRDDFQGLKAWTRENGDIDRYILHATNTDNLPPMLNWYRANFTPASLNAKSNPPRIKVPAMGISAGKDDYLLEEHVRNSENMMDSSWEYYKIENVSHWLMLDQPEEVNRLLINFLLKHN